MASGPSTVIQAVASARDAATAIRAHLGSTQTTGGEKRSQTEFIQSYFEEIPRALVPEPQQSERVKGVAREGIPGLTLPEAEREAHRCFNCGCLAVVPSDVGIALVALGGTIVTTKRSVLAQDFFSASATSCTVLDPDELIKEIRIPKPPAGAHQKYEKFTLRKPVDFAIVSVASLVTEEDGVCKDARIVLGAVAPEPVRVKKAEDAIRGRSITETTATEAAEQAVKGAMALSLNDYKIAITKALVKRAIMA